ncbi:MAG: hypothetical protein AAFU79_29915 [Myxococcota bacterium]
MADAEAAVEEGVEPGLPPADISLRGHPSPLSAVIAEGLGQLARAEGWSAQRSALDVRMGTMAEGASKPTADASLAESGFVRLLQRSGDRKRAVEDGRQLARLALVAVGDQGLPAAKADRERQLEGDLKEVGSAIQALIRDDDPRLTTRVEGLAQNIAFTAEVMGRSRASRSAQPRLDAVVAMLKILVRHAGDLSKGTPG